MRRKEKEIIKLIMEYENISYEEALEKYKHILNESFKTEGLPPEIHNYYSEVPVYVEFSLSEISDISCTNYKLPELNCFSMETLLNSKLNHIPGGMDDEDILNVPETDCFIEYYVNDNIYKMIVQDAGISSTLILKLISKNNPIYEKYLITGNVKNYPFQKNDIDQKIMEELCNLFNSLFPPYGHEKYDELYKGIAKAYIHIDREKNITAELYGFLTDKNGIPLKYKKSFSNRDEVEKLLNEMKKIVCINKVSEHSSIKVILNEDRTFIYEYEGKKITSSELETIYIETIKKFKLSYKQKIEEIIKLYSKFSELFIYYQKRYNRISKLSEYLSNYNSKIKTLWGILFLGKIKNFNEDILLNSIDVSLTDSESIEDNLYANFLIFTEEDIDTDIEQLIERYFRLCKSFDIIKNEYISLEQNNLIIEEQLELLESEYQKIRGQKFFDRLKKPFVVNGIHESLPNFQELKKNRKKQHLVNKNIEQREEEKYFDYLQVIQSELLTPEEKTALMVYKTKLYRVINRIIFILRNNPNSSLYDCEKFIQEGYISLKEAYESSNMFVKKNYRDDRNRLNKLLPSDRLIDYEEYKGIIYKYINFVESALNKVFLNKELVVYRAIGFGGKNKLDNGFLSTTTSMECALDILKKRTVGQGGFLYKINLMSGSPIGFFSWELWTGEINHENPFNDSQKEVLIDGNNFDFQIVSTTKYQDLYYCCNELELIEVNAIPKRKKISINIATEKNGEDNQLEVSDSNKSRKR